MTQREDDALAVEGIGRDGVIIVSRRQSSITVSNAASEWRGSARTGKTPSVI
jgi:hypothetical protein